MIKAVIIDDEKRARDLLSHMIVECADDVKVVATASSVKTGYNIIKEYNPELVFLDIELEDGQGFDILKLFENIEFKIIFITAFFEYAVKAFKVNAIDYLLKPVMPDELKAAIQKAIGHNGHETNSDIYKNIADLIKTAAEHNDEPYITIPNLKGFDILKVKDIIMCSADGYCTNFHLTGGRKIVSSKNLKHYDEILHPHKFVRVHHSYLINPNHVCNYSKQGEIFLSDNNKAFLGDKFKTNFTHLFTRNN
jgi:two-component system, LytTR family, response regulator